MIYPGEQCEKLQTQKYYEIAGNKVTKIENNNTGQHPVKLAGKRHSDGYGKGGFYEDKFGRFEGAIVGSYVKITLLRTTILRYI